MQDYNFLPKCREIIAVQIRKNTITGTLCLLLLMIILLPVIVYLAMKSDYVTYLFWGYAIFVVIGIALIAWYRTAKLNWTHIDSRDMSRIITTDETLSQEVIIQTKNKGNYTYGDLRHVMNGYERLSAASQYTMTGENRKFRVTGRGTGKALRMALKPLKFISYKSVFLLIVMAQIGVMAGVLPTIKELLTGQPLPTLSLHMSLREIATQIVAPRAVTIGVLYALKLLITKQK
ncbi:hypothetical protein LCC34_004262 [Salmonella enterica]|uniref:hypothetical protein n=1 Tax=Enterobacteriaceae TaxID=543 RepID=UPI00097307E0|nr:hypothetical protein [Shigella sonnei]EAB6670242.1 hypothetical protein [Salmonella enterica subsp. enterica serovar Enteritidis]EBT9640211.1 hypothetical protein [Salmonella enterica]ECH8003160.1 hypothetical protein [Salmonella enterica subsp. enterica serovar Bovismorbificans]EDB9860849.1 hypothetical protein [Salmonella enterica subsp. enterica serovar Newport]EES5599029.1 hypothetical protein [Escherichia coli]